LGKEFRGLVLDSGRWSLFHDRVTAGPLETNRRRMVALSSEEARRVRAFLAGSTIDAVHPARSEATPLPGVLERVAG
jgi:hypothetical protein